MRDLLSRARGAPDEFIPPVTLRRSNVWVGLLVGLPVLATTIVVLASVGGSTPTFVLVGSAIPIVIVVLVTALVGRNRRAWLWVSAGATLMLASSLADRLATSPSRNLMLGSDTAHVVALIALAIGAYRLPRRGRPGKHPLSRVDALIVGLALAAGLWPVIRNPIAASGADDTAANWLLLTRPFLAIALIAIAVSALFALRSTSALLMFVALCVLGSADLLRSVGIVHRTDELLIVISFAIAALLAIAASTDDSQGPDRATHPANRLRTLCVLGIALMCSGLPIADAWVSGALTAATVLTGAWVMAILVLVEIRLWWLAADARTSALRHESQLVGALVQGLNDAVFVVNADGIISYGSPRAELVLGIERRALVGSSLLSYFPETEASQIERRIRFAGQRSNGEPLEVCGGFTDREGRERDFELAIMSLLDDPDVGGIVITMRDVTVRRQLTRELERRAFRDSLTQLANRALFTDRLQHAQQRSARTAATFAVVLIDLDDFKAVNDGLGHAAGDALLVAVAERLQTCVRPSDTIARIGGDEFAVLIDTVNDISEVLEIAERLREVLQLPVSVGDLALSVPASFGVAVAVDGTGHPNLMRDADIALYEAKNLGKNRVVQFDQSMGWNAYSRIRLRSQLESALTNDEFRLEFQPIVSLPSNIIVGIEALARWAHPTQGMLQPGDFIPLAEENGLIVELGRWVLDQACHQASKWIAEGHDIYISVNVSARQLAEETLAADVEAALSRSGLAPGRLMLELTETALIDEDARNNLVQRVAPLGVQIAIDDFGTGYSSLSYLQQLPVTAVKLDRSFVAQVGDEGVRAVVRSVSAISAVMGYGTIAEGIETEAEATDLASLNYGFAQGFHYSRPVEAQLIGELLEEQERGAVRT
jgi:diguanylate cyclase (GGDEF)-like protein/PAS domain S-box-containing protein